MRAVVFKSTREVAVEDVPDARVEQDHDVVVRVTSSALCGTDLHMYDGRTGASPGMVLGHEGLGVVEAAGPAVQRVRRGDRVVLPAHIYCGVCFNCSRGYSAACLRVYPGHAGGAYAMPGMGPFRGSQAELVRVPFADANCVVLPGAADDEHEDDFVLIADAWVTGWHATELAGVKAADTVAVFGAGAVGLLAAYSARLRGASEVYSVDLVAERLDKAAEFGFVPVDARQGDPVEQIRDLRRTRTGARLPGEQEMGGVMAGIDAVGFQARDRHHPDRENPRQVINDLARLVNPTGRLGIAGVWHRPVGRGCPVIRGCPSRRRLRRLTGVLVCAIYGVSSGRGGHREGRSRCCDGFGRSGAGDRRGACSRPTTCTCGRWSAGWARCCRSSCWPPIRSR